MDTLHCFNSGTVVANLQSTGKYDAIRELIRKAPVFSGLAEREIFEKAVVGREMLQTTVLGHGVAVAHGRTEGIRRVLIALGMSRDGIAYDSPDGEPVRLLFIIASPPHMSLEYLQTLSTLVRCVHQQSVRDSLLNAPNAEDLEDRIRRLFHAEMARCSGSQPCGPAQIGSASAQIRRSASAQ